MKKLTILIDLDNVCADLMSKWLREYNVKYNDALTSEKITNWQIELHASKCSSGDFYSIIGQPHFFADLEVFSDAIEVTKKLKNDGHILYFVTATPFDNPTAGYDKHNWVDKHFPHIGRHYVIQTHHKYMIKGDVLFDDGPTNLQTFNGIKVAMDMPYNQNVAVNYRVKNWNDFYTTIDQIISIHKGI